MAVNQAEELLEELRRERTRTKRLLVLLAFFLGVLVVLLSSIAVLVFGARDGIAVVVTVLTALAALIAIGIYGWRLLQWVAERLSP